MGKLQSLYVVQERDIDLLLLEELQSNASFVEWFGRCVGLQNPAFDNAAQMARAICSFECRSVTSALGS